jgi:hypothetical protein
MKNRKTTAKKIRGISPVISTIIISATLLIILVIASFFATNMLELQMANTEFEQAKTNMMLLDEVIQDVALRPGSGGHVRFNQRSGGINVIQDAETLKILGPSTEIINPALTRSPSNNSGNWTNPTGAYADDMDYATSSLDNNRHRFHGFGFSIPESAKAIKSVEVGVDAKTVSKGLADEIKLEVSTNGGQSYLSKSDTSKLSESELTFWFNVTSWENWTRAKINDDKIWVQVTQVSKGKADTVYIDWIRVKVTYTSEAPELIYQSPSLVSIVYRGGSKVSGADIPLRGEGSLIVDMTSSLGYLRVETGSGVQIKLDYNRVRIMNYGVLVGGDRLTNVTVITFIQLTQGKMGGLETLNVKVQNMFNINPVTREYNAPNVTLRIQLGDNLPEPVTLSSTDPTVTTTVILKAIVVQVSTM